ncbi:multidrug transporter [Sphingomonas crocodyli]|uniref:Multidrug transporter n=1 Tax=Sphingomonas crocodyli TaxID=1979270 RepID=A0A437LYK6_9SPHN|nr:multidrug transporter [Sphingomonas crocodyli]RVT90519.1 multidrug transporter [Sphingomonas crocodyli]
MIQWLLLIAGIASNASASLLVKAAVGKPISLQQPFAIGNLIYGSAIGLYMAAFVLYAAAVSRMPLTIAHPVTTAGAILVVGVSATLLFNEQMSPLRIAGYCFLFIGIACIGLSKGVPA